MSNILIMLKERRKELGITQTQMAQRLGISQSQYQKIENGGNPSLKTLTSIALALNMKLMLTPIEKSLEIEQIIKPRKLQPLTSLLEKFEIKDHD